MRLWMRAGIPGSASDGVHPVISCSCWWKQLTRLYSEQNRVRAFKKLIARDSKSEDGLQFADMVVGALAERIQHGESPYDDYIDSKTVDLWFYPGQ